MRDDRLDAQAVVNGADVHIPVLQERFVTWQRRRPYELIVEPDPDDGDWEFLIAYLRAPLDPLIAGDVSVIISSVRTSLDVLMSALLTSYGIKPNSKAHFPIRRHASDLFGCRNDVGR